MVPYLLDALYLALLFVAFPWLLAEAVRKGKYRRGFAAKFLGLVPERKSNRPCAWLHAVSVGEVNLLTTLVDELSRRRPDWQFVISTTTLTGYSLARLRFPGYTVFYCPLDFSWATRRAVRRVRPELLILAELELWPNLIRAARQGGARVAVVNGRLRDRSYRGYRRVRMLLAPVLRQIDLIAAQSRQYAERFTALGAPSSAVYVTGSLKFDGAQADRQNAATQNLRRLASFEADDIVFLAGSTQEGEEALALDAYRELRKSYPRLRLVLVPRHPERFERVAGLLAASGLAWQRRSELDYYPADSECRVLLIDRVGELAAWWGTTQIAFVGGSLGRRGGQNMIEPAAYGAAVCFGPQTKNFRDAVQALREKDAAVVVQDGAELTAFVRRCLLDPTYANQLGNRAKTVVASHLGATRRTADLLEALLPRSVQPMPRKMAA